MKTVKRIGIASICALPIIMAPVYADDTEIYSAVTVDPATMFLIDTSGSMLFSANASGTSNTCFDGIGQTFTNGCEVFYKDRRIARVRDAMVSVLNSLSDNNRVGIARYNSNSSGGRILYPVRKLSDPGVNNSGISTRQDLINLMNQMADTNKVSNGQYWANQSYYMGGGTPLHESYYEVARYFHGDTPSYGSGSHASALSGGKYISPIQCPGSPSITSAGKLSTPYSIIALTDGEPSLDDDSVAYPNGGCGAPWGCMSKTSGYLSSTGVPSIKPSERARVKTTTIGFGPQVASPSGSGYQGLLNVANNGRGDFQAVSNSAALVNTITASLASNSEDAGQATVTVPASLNSKTQTSDQLYFSLFSPSLYQRWQGNLKRYQFLNGTIVDAIGLPAIDAASDSFLATARSFWSASVDGANVKAGGAAGQQTSARTVYTDNGVGTLTTLTAANLANNTSAFNWIKGLDSAGNPRKDFGAPIHSQPVSIQFDATPANQMTYVSDNDGLLHAINSSDGTERWSWLPQALQSRVVSLQNGTTIKAGANGPLYGLDGNWTSYKGADNYYLIGGMRQGGSNVYAINLGASKTATPALAWVKTPSDTGFTNLGYTWSKPIISKYKINGATVDVAIFAGGLDYSKYELGGAGYLSSLSEVQKGSSIYMVNAQTGALIWRAEYGTGTSTTNITYSKDMRFSITGSVRPVDRNGDGIPDLMYFADLGGQVFRVDINNESSNSSVKRVRRIANLGIANTNNKANDRRFYETPAVALQFETDNNQKKYYAAVAIGSGDRNWPRSNKTTQDQFYVLKDYDANRSDLLSTNLREDGIGTNGVPKLVDVITNTDVADVGSLNTVASVNSALSGKKGWYLSMPSEHKALSSASILSAATSAGAEYRVLFGVYNPALTAGGNCDPQSGKTDAWQVLLTTGLPIDTDKNGIYGESRVTSAIANGIGGDPYYIIDGTGQLKPCIGRGCVEGATSTLGIKPKKWIRTN